MAEKKPNAKSKAKGKPREKAKPKASLSDFSLQSDSEAKNLASPFRMLVGNKGSQIDPFRDDIAPSLLSADDIARYVEKTGMICPFEQTKNGKSKLKAASYEGGIGSCAFTFEPGRNVPKKIFSSGDEFLVLPPNSIVFVESDVYFRLPPFIAVRFNLQIRLVHRGLLLGTGPLVDPGFWGKLCIPLHNLTDEEYVIPKDEGLIWIEFTKTTSYPKLGTPPSNRDLHNIKKAIEKASKPFDEVVSQYEERNATERILDRILPNGAKPPKPVGIRSSIQTKFLEAAKSSKKAMKAAKKAQLTGFGVGAVSVISVLGLWGTYYKDTNSQHDKLEAKILALDKSISGHLSSIEVSAGASSEAKSILSIAAEKQKKNEERIRSLEEQLKSQTIGNDAEIEKLKDQISQLELAAELTPDEIPPSE